MAKLEISTKRLAISKANAQMVAIVGAAAFVTIFCLVAAKAVWSQTRYQSRVTAKSEIAHQQLQKNLSAFKDLVSSYNAFEATNPNIIGGNPNGGTGPNDGDNAEIILHALPSSYDFPALTASLEKILKTGGFNVSSITGTDDQLSQQGNTSSPTPQAVSMPFSFTVNNTNYTSIQQLIDTLQRSIRPIQVDNLTLSGGADNTTLTVNAHTYYQPGKSVNITKEEVK
ncbi:MAG TPA: hypothetical protein VIJ68_04825 [Candidatus Saccharimonadales bacterium]